MLSNKLQVRLMNAPEDYKNLRINPEKIEKWEDGRRDNDEPGHWCWWYFDAILDDGTAVVIQFMQKSFQTINDNVAHPAITFKITLPDGTSLAAQPTAAVEDCTYSTEKCDTHFGRNFFTGDLDNYHIHIEPINNLAADIHMKRLVQSYRPGTAYFDFGNGKYYTWLRAVPRGEVSGTLTINGEEKTIHGYGYHDHQWGNFFYLAGWNHWTWARHNFEDYSLVLFDMTAAKSFGSTHFPLAFLADKNGNILFTNEDEIDYKVLEEDVEPSSGKPYPKVSQYIFTTKDEMTYKYTLTEESSLDSLDVYKVAPAPAKAAFDQLGIQPSYTRYMGTGKLEFTDKNGNNIVRESKLIYEFMYPGKSYK